MALEKCYESPAGQTPPIIIYRNKPGQFYVQFQQEGMQVHDFTVDEILLRNNAMTSVHDYQENIDKPPSKLQRQAFEIARTWLIHSGK